MLFAIPKVRFAIVAAIAAATMAVSCDSESHGVAASAAGNAPTEADDSQITLRVSLTLPVLPASGSRALSAAQIQGECVVSDVLLMLFTDPTATGQLVTAVAVDGDRITATAPDDYRHLTFDTRFAIPAGYASAGTFSAVFLANAAVYSSTLTPGSTYAEVQRQLTSTSSTPLDAIPPFHFWARCSIFNKVYAQEASVMMLRDLARVEIDATPVADRFTLSDVYIYRPSSTRCLMPSLQAERDLAAAGHVITPSLPAAPDFSTVDTPWHYPGVAIQNVVTHEVYIPEGDVIMGGEAIPCDERHTDRPAIVVGAYYKDSPVLTYYRIDFREPDGTPAEGDDQAYKLIDILRNHSYNITVRSVSGPGQDTPDDAYEAIEARISSDVIDWRNIDQEITWQTSGESWMSVETKQVELGGYLGSYREISIAGDTDPVTPDMIAWDDPAQTRFTVEPVITSGPDEETGEWAGTLLITSLQALHDGDEPITESFTITAGVLTLHVTVTQRPCFGTAWDDGGNVSGSL